MTLEDELAAAQQEMKPDVDNLGRLGKAVTAMLAKRLEVAEMENKLAQLKREYQAYAIGEVPTLMAELNLSQVMTKEGVRIIVDREVQCKFIPEQKEQALDWLGLNNYGALIKHEVSVEFGKDSEQIAKRAVEALRSVGLEPTVSIDVHHATLKAWGKRMIEDNAEIPSDLFQVNVFSLAKVK